MRYLWPVVFCVFFCVPALATVPEDTLYRLEMLLDERSKQEFRDGKMLSDRQKRRLEDLLNMAVRTMAMTPASVDRERLRILSQSASKAREQAAISKMQMALAPENSSPGISLLRYFLPASREDWQNRAEKNEKQAKQYEEEMQHLTEKFRIDLQKIGVLLTPLQVKTLLSMATVDHVVEIRGLLDNMKSIVHVLQSQSQDPPLSFEVQRRYYGLYAVMIETALHAHQVAIDHIDAYYIPALQRIRAANASAQAETRLLLNTASVHERSILQKNADAQRLTERASNRYMDWLNQQRRHFYLVAQQLRAQSRVAINTWKTVQVASDLSLLWKDGVRQLETIKNFDLPLLQPFETKDVEQEFQRLGEQIRAASS